MAVDIKNKNELEEGDLLKLKGQKRYEEFQHYYTDSSEDKRKFAYLSGISVPIDSINNHVETFNRDEVFVYTK